MAATALAGLGVVAGLLAIALPFASFPSEKNPFLLRADRISSPGDSADLVNQSHNLAGWMPEAYASSLVLLVLSGLALALPSLRGGRAGYLLGAFGGLPLVAGVVVLAEWLGTAHYLSAPNPLAKEDYIDVEGGFEPHAEPGFWLYLAAAALLIAGGVLGAAYALGRSPRPAPLSPHPGVGVPSGTDVPAAPAGAWPGFPGRGTANGQTPGPSERFPGSPAAQPRQPSGWDARQAAANSRPIARTAIVTGGRRAVVLVMLGLGSVLGILACVVPFARADGEPANRHGEVYWEVFASSLFRRDLGFFILALVFSILVLTCLALLLPGSGRMRTTFPAAIGGIPLLAGTVLLAHWFADIELLRKTRIVHPGAEKMGKMATREGADVGFWLVLACAILFVAGGLLALLFARPRPAPPSIEDVGPYDASWPAGPTPAQSWLARRTRLLAWIVAAISIVGLLALLMPHQSSDIEKRKETGSLAQWSTASLGLLTLCLAISVLSLAFLAIALPRGRKRSLALLGAIPLASGVVMFGNHIRDVKKSSAHVLNSAKLSEHDISPALGTWSHVLCSLLIILAGSAGSAFALRWVSTQRTGAGPAPVPAPPDANAPHPRALPIGPEPAALAHAPFDKPLPQTPSGWADAASGFPVVAPPGVHGGALPADPHRRAKRLRAVEAVLICAGLVLAIVVLFVPFATLEFVSPDNPKSDGYTLRTGHPFAAAGMLVFFGLSLVCVVASGRRSRLTAIAAGVVPMVGGVIVAGDWTLHRWAVRTYAATAKKVDEPHFLLHSEYGSWMHLACAIVLVLAGIVGTVRAMRTPAPDSDALDGTRGKLAFSVLLGCALAPPTCILRYMRFDPQFYSPQLPEPYRLFDWSPAQMVTFLVLVSIAALSLALLPRGTSVLRRRLRFAAGCLPAAVGLGIVFYSLSNSITLSLYFSAEADGGYWFFPATGLAFLIGGTFAIVWMLDAEGIKMASPPPLNQNPPGGFRLPNPSEAVAPPIPASLGTGSPNREAGAPPRPNDPTRFAPRRPSPAEGERTPPPGGETNHG